MPIPHWARASLDPTASAAVDTKKKATNGRTLLFVITRSSNGFRLIKNNELRIAFKAMGIINHFAAPV
jgi:hypothetical protein